MKPNSVRPFGCYWSGVYGNFKRLKLNIRAHSGVDNHYSETLVKSDLNDLKHAKTESSLFEVGRKR